MSSTDLAVESDKDLFVKSKKNQNLDDKKLQTDCKTMRDAFNRFINIDVPSSFKYRDSEYYFKSIGDTFRMYEFRHPMECISNFGEIKDKIEKKLSLKISIRLESEKSFYNNYRFELREVAFTDF